MAITANRTKKAFNLVEIIKSILISLNRFLILFFLAGAFFLFIINPKKISSISLEITGYFLSTGIIIYEDLFKAINLISKNLASFQDLSQKNIELRLKIAELQRIQNNFESIKAENIVLKTLLTAVNEEEQNYITAKLLSVSLTPFGKTAIIFAGSKHGAAIDQVVVNSEGLIGKIIETSANYSKVMLVNDNNSRIPITIVSSREKGILVGDGNRSKILHLQSNNLIQKGEKIITSGYGNIYPAGIMIGVIQQVTNEGTYVIPLADLSRTEFVKILGPVKFSN